jgi:thymidylate synthase (FAD)
VGVVKNIKSQRYTDSSQLEWHVPDEIKNDEGLRKIWDCHMDVAQLAYKSIISKLEEVYGYTGEKAREIARGVIPMDMMSEGVFGFTIEALENLMEKRLCNRAQAPIQELARQMKKEVVDVLPALKEFLAPPCMKYSVCPEGKHQCSQFKDVFLTTDEFNQLRTQPEYITLVKTIKEGE